MRHHSNWLKAFALSILAALATMAFAAVGAQASGGEWLVLNQEGKALTIEELEPQLAALSITPESVTRITILGLNLLLKCASTTVTNAYIEPVGHGKAEMAFKECYYTNLKLAKNLECEIADFTIKVLMLLINHHGEGFVLFSPESGLTFASVLNTGETCILQHTWIFKGHFVAKFLPFFLSHYLVAWLITTKGPMLKLFPNHTVRYGSLLAHFEFDGLLELAGDHSDLSWGYHLL